MGITAAGDTLVCARQTQARTESPGEPEETKPEAFHDPGADGTCIPGDQAAVWIYPNPLPRIDEECCPGEHADGLGQPVSAALAVADGLRGNPLKMPPKNGLWESVFKKLAVALKNLKAINRSTLL